ncbi:hypothetical protein BABINDRAFT_161050 [Babjeviella inositovora NRRL Y-12698]|uniref:Uncharacterized protein n=1 Tax=Babjeviella inositovora NRRL Y-12698 TaxID=984486 RepID=A0A1E3QV63_9ASCO|nr:uncharacterized protein BABINDRAFT_161050 [Babjeviella inositovora NRRL Y-12698]ODQ80847.1 hypothetical protein BABINDRAFT_161050 [Babjeviella inositovora NRRL Y-12698]
MPLVILHGPAIFTYTLANIILDLGAFRNRTNILIVETPGENQSQFWCYNPTNDCTQFILHENHILPVESMVRSHGRDTMNMDRVPNCIISLKLGPHKPQGFLYNPSVYLHHLRAKLGQTGLVSYTSLLSHYELSHHSLDRLARQFQGQVMTFDALSLAEQSHLLRRAGSGVSLCNMHCTNFDLPRLCLVPNRGGETYQITGNFHSQLTEHYVVQGPTLTSHTLALAECLRVGFQVYEEIIYPKFIHGEFHANWHKI